MDQEQLPDDREMRAIRYGWTKWLQGPRHEPPDPAGFRRIAYERIPLSRVTLIGLISAPIWLGIFLFTAGFLGNPQRLSFAISFLDLLFGILLLLIVVPVVHEAVHGIAAQLVGAHPSYGIGSGFAYTTFLEPVSKGEYLLIGLAPLVVLSIIGMAVMVLVPSIAGLTLVFPGRECCRGDG